MSETMSAIHASAKMFDELDTDFVGVEGQGLQTHGWGVYLTTSLDVGEVYKQDNASSCNSPDMAYCFAKDGRGEYS
jgi:hypothetical protein